jgi:WD40 repeat protein/tRNA A-37 threonylcarbamoyl transferase component Bud32
VVSERNDAGSQERLDAIVAAYLREVEAGWAVDRQELLARHPDLAIELEAFFHDEDQLGRFVAPLRDNSAPSEPQTAAGGKDRAADESSATLHFDGQLFGDYELLGEIARGGMGVVYKARQISLNRLVALKMILAGQLASAAAVERFRAEAEAAAHLDHPHIVPIYEVGEQQGQHYYSMKFIDGGSLARAVASEQWAVGGPEAGRRAAAVAATVARAVHHAHQRGVLHRDLKPANILLEWPAGGSNPPIPHVTDFGLAKRLDDDAGLTQSGAIVGTPSYMAPEQAIGKRGPGTAGGMLSTAADIYSLGVILYEMLTGRPPFRGATRLDTLLQVIHDEPPRPRLLQPRIVSDLETICLKCLQKEPQQRYPSAQALADDLQRFLDGEPIEARPIGPVERFGRWCRRSPIVAGLTGLVALLLITVAAGATLEALRLGSMAERERGLRAEAEDQKSKADAERRNAEEAQQKEEAAGRAKEVVLTDMHTAFGVAADERQDPGQALLWFANAVRLSRNDPERTLANRVRVQTWSRQLHRPVCALPHEEQVFRGFVFHQSGNYLLTLGVSDQGTLWDLTKGKSVPLPGKRRQVSSAAWSPDGRRLALGRPDGRVEVFRSPSGEIEHELMGRGAIGALVYSSDGHYLAMASADVVRVWDSRTWEPATAELVHPQPVETLTFNGRGDRLATGCLDMRVRVFRVPGEERDAQPLFAPLPHEWPGDLRDVRSGRRIVPPFIDHDRGLLTASALGEATWWNATTGQRLHTVPGPVERHHVMSLVASPDGRYFFLGALGKGQFWDITTGRVGRDVFHRNSIGSAAFSPDGKTLLTASIDGTARLWSVPDGQPLSPPLPHQAAVHVAGFAPDGGRLATAQEGGLVRVWAPPERDARDYRLPLDGKVSRVRLSPDGRYLIPCGTSFRGGSLMSTRVYEAATGNALGPPLRPGGPLLDAALSPDRRHVATLRARAATTEDRLEQLKRGDEQAGQLHVWDWGTGRVAFPPVDLPSAPRSLDYSPDGRHLCVLCARGQVLLLEAASGRIARPWQYGSRFQPANEYAGNGSVRFSPDGRSILAWGMDETVRTWDTATGKARGAALVHRQKCHDVQFSADGRLLATASYDRTARVWDSETGQPQIEPLPHPDWVFAARFSPDGRFLLTACRDGMARLWDWRTGRLVCPPFQHDSEVFDVAFTPGGRWVITASHDATARVWEWRTGKPVTPSLGLGGMGLTVVVTPDGSRAIVAGFGNTVHAFHLGDLKPPENVSPDQLCLQAEVLSGQQVHEGGAAKLTAEEWLRRWQEMHIRDLDHGSGGSRSGGAGE